MGLPSLELSPGTPFSLGSDDSLGAGGLGALIGEDLFAWILRGLWALTLLCLFLYILLSIFTPEGRRRVKRDILVFAMLLLVSQFLPNLLEKAGISNDVQETELPQSIKQMPTMIPKATFSPDPPAWISVITVLLAAILISALIIGLLLIIRRRKTKEKNPLQRLAGEAQTALDSLHAGRDLKSVIIQCYLDMVKVVEEERGILRQTAMTPREFEASLISKGLPQQPVITITRLFEKVRYGSLALDSAEENLAFASLSDIVNACQSLGELHEVE